MSSTALPGKFNDEVECYSMFYKQEHKAFRVIDRRTRCGAGIEIPDKTRTSNQCWMQFGSAKVLCSDGGSALNNDATKCSP
eukprot:4529679-Pyramimonas_sp.AAC.1